MIVQLARQGGRDAVFDVPAQVLRSAPGDPRVTVRLTDDPSRDRRSAACARSRRRPIR